MLNLKKNKQMAKELPYFKFEPNAWENGNIQMLSREDKGLFIDICSMYWSRLGDLPLKLVIQKLCYGNKDALSNLINEEIIDIKKDEKINICFLSKQLSEFNIQSKVNSDNAKSRWETTPERMKGNIVYVIRCWNENENFIKIGITTTSISRRFSGKMPYEYETLVVDYYDNIELESQYKKIAKQYEYNTKQKFEGYFECFKIDAIPDIIAFAKIRNAKYVRNECETDAIREEKSREEKKKEDINSGKPEKLDFNLLIDYLNKKTGRAFRIVNETVKKKYTSTLNQGYTKEDIRTAIDNAVKAKNHIDNNFQHLTLEFFSRPDKLDMYSAKKESKGIEGETEEEKDLRIRRASFKNIKVH